MPGILISWRVFKQPGPRIELFRWLTIMIALALIIPLTLIPGQGANKAQGTEYLFDRMITWMDGTKEWVQIDRDGFFHLNGIRRRMVGFELGASFPTGRYYEPETLALINKELIYLQSIGIRTIEVLLPYSSNDNAEVEYYVPLLDLIYQHKMLALPVFTAKWTDGFNNLGVGDFQFDNSDDSVGAWASRWISVVRNYSNVVMIAVENEIDHRLLGHTYSWEEAARYMEYITGVFREELPEVPILTKLMGYFPGDVIDAIKSVVFPYQDIPGWDPYAHSTWEMGYRVGQINAWMRSQGWEGKGWWVTETNTQVSAAGFDAGEFNVSFLDAQFDRGVTVSYLWTMNNLEKPASAFFDFKGDPVPSLIELAGEIGRLQAPIYPPGPLPNLPGENTFGLDIGNGSWESVPDMVEASRFENTVGTGILTGLELLVDTEVSTGRVRLGVYADNNGIPGDLLLDAGEVPVSHGWVSISGLNLPVTYGSNYWLAFNLQYYNGIRYMSDQTEKSHHWMRSGYGSLPRSFVISDSAVNNTRYVMRAAVEVK